MKMTIGDKLGVSSIVAMIGFLLIVAYGWIANIIKLIVSLDGGGITSMFIARCVGAVFAPLGILLGYF